MADDYNAYDDITSALMTADEARSLMPTESPIVARINNIITHVCENGGTGVMLPKYSYGYLFTQDIIAALQEKGFNVNITQDDIGISWESPVDPINSNDNLGH